MRHDCFGFKRKSDWNPQWIVLALAVLFSSCLSSQRHARRLTSLGNLRQPYTHFGPTPIGTDQLDVATMRSSQLPRDAQTQPVPWHACASAHTVETLE